MTKCSLPKKYINKPVLEKLVSLNGSLNTSKKKLNKINTVRVKHLIIHFINKRKTKYDRLFHYIK
jgi:hypothetical protein